MIAIFAYSTGAIATFQHCLQTDVIDLYYLHRWDQQVPIEDSVSALGELVRQGHIRSIGLSEVSAATLDACKALGIAFAAFSPLGRGFLGGTLQDVSKLHPTDIRRAMPRFAPDPYAANLKLLPAYLQVARDAGCTPAQLAMTWLLQRGEHIIPIPGTTSVPHLCEDLAAVNVPLNAAKLDTLINQATVVGARYNAQSHGEVDTGNF